MRLKLSDLQQVVKETLQEKKHSDAFCDEIKKVFGPSVIVGNTLGSLVEAANEHLDVLEYKGHLDTVHFSDKVALGMVNHESADVRKFVARILPESVASSLLLDRNASVRIAAAKKSSAKMIKEALRKFPNDVALNDLFEEKKKDKVSALEAAASSKDEDMLSEEWYDGVARKLIQDYGRTLDTTWKTSAVKQYCSSVRASTRVNVDAVKLMQKMDSLLSTYDQARAKELGINESLQRLISESEIAEDPIDDIIGESLSPKEFIDRCNEVFNIRYATLPPGIMKYKIREGLSLNKIPVSCMLTHNSSPRRIDEIALDTFVDHWNDKQKMMGEPFKLSWDNHPESMNKITFKVELK
jgi:hypothetical protein